MLNIVDFLIPSTIPICKAELYTIQNEIKKMEKDTFRNSCNELEEKINNAKQNGDKKLAKS